MCPSNHEIIMCPTHEQLRYHPATSQVPTPASPRPRNFRRYCGSMTWLLTDLLSLIFFVGKNNFFLTSLSGKTIEIEIFSDKGLRFCFLGYTN